MCGIVGVIGPSNSVELVKRALELMNTRGADASGLYADGKVSILDSSSALTNANTRLAMGHRLHAVVSKVPQPLKREGVLVANTEIYNWKVIAPTAKNDADALLKVLDADGIDAIRSLDGVFAFAYVRDGKVWLARDVLGVKPLWYSSTTESFAFASEAKVLASLGFDHVQELNPRDILCVDVDTLALSRTRQDFFTAHVEVSDESTAVNGVVDLLTRAVLKRVPQRPFGLLFSGGVDSTIIAKILYDAGHRVPCYTVSVEGFVSKDAIAAREVAHALDLDLREVVLSQEDLASILPEVTSLIEDSNVVKVGVAATFFKACERASSDGLKVLLSGLGSEEIFAGYQRHAKAIDVNKECVSGLLKMYERDLYRDDVVSMRHQVELRLPFLDHTLVKYALTISPTLKIRENTGKWVLRKAAINLGVPKEFALRPKSAAQYGSAVDKMIAKLARKSKMSKSEFLAQFYAPANVKLGVLFSGGKDSTYAAQIMKDQNYELTCLLTMRSKNEASYMFHTPAIDITSVQAQAMGVPILYGQTQGVKEAELDDLKTLFMRAKERYGIQGVVTGALFSSYQRDRIERICDSLGLKIFSPLWHKPQEQEMQELLDRKYVFIFSSVAADGLDKSWLGTPISGATLKKLKLLNERIGLNIAGEGGEFESLVLDCPLFTSAIHLDFDVVEESVHVARIEPKGAHLVPKSVDA